MAFLELLMQLRNPVLSLIMLSISYLGTPFFVVGVITFLSLAGRRNRAEGMMMAFLFSGILCQGLKIVFHIPRPWIIEPDTSLFSPVAIALPTATGYSFPSIHVQSTTALCISLIYYFKKKAVRIPSVLFLVLVAFSRMYLGCHTPADVLAGFLITLAVSMITLPLWNRFSSKSLLNRELFSFFLAGFSLILIFLSAVLVNNGTADAALSQDAFEMAGMGLGFSVSMTLGRHLPDGNSVSVPMRLICFAFAIAGFLVLEAGLPSVFPESLLSDTIRYALISLWLFGAAPVVLTRMGLLKNKT